MDRTTNIFGMPQRPLTASLVGTLLMLSVPTAQARQAATSFEELPVLLEVGDTINITDTMGRDVRGRLVEFSPSMLGLEVGSSRVYSGSAVQTRSGTGRFGV